MINIIFPIYHWFMENRFEIEKIFYAIKERLEIR